MNKYLLWGTLAATVLMFSWQTLSNTTLGWHEATMERFEDPEMIVAAVAAAAPENGMYFHERGIMAAVSMVPGVSDKSHALIGPMLARQVALDLIAAFLLALVVARLAFTPVRAALLLGGVALAAGVILELSNWNWYGFPLAYSLVNVLDSAINVAIAAAILGWYAQRIRPAEAAAAAPAEAMAA